MSVEENWGRLRILIGEPGAAMVDCTFFRGIPTLVQSVSWSDPFSDETLVIQFPQISPFEQYGVGALAWLGPFSNVVLQRVHPDGVTTSTLWEGLTVEYQQNLDERAGTLTVTCIGILHQVGFYVRAPKSSRAPDTLEVICANEFSTADGNRPHLRTNPLTVTGGPTGISFVHRPAWLDARAFLFEMLSRSALSGSDQWTIRKVAPRTPNLIKRSAYGSTWTMTCGTPGLSLRLNADFTTQRNGIYGEGVDTYGGGGKWRNFILKPEEYFQPLSYDTSVHPHDEDGSGGLTTNYARLDRDDVRIEDFINFGEGVSRSEAQSMAELYRIRDHFVGYAGSATLRSDPVEGSRFDIREGDLFVIPYHVDNPSGTNLHVAKVEWNWPDMSVTLSLDTKNRDNDVLQRILERKREGTSPAKRLQLGRDSGQIADSKFPWDTEAGSGWFPRTRTPRFNGGVEGSQTVSCTGGTWTITEILGGEGPDTIVRTLIRASISTPFAVVVTDWKITSADLPVNPLTAAATWYQNVTGLLYAAGSLGQRAGYYPSTEVDGGAVTGVHVDEDAWTVTHSRGEPEGVGGDDYSGSPAKLWVGIFPLSTANFRGLLTHGVE